MIYHLWVIPLLGDNKEKIKIRAGRTYFWKSKVEKKTGTGNKILTPNKLLTRLPVLLA